MANNRLYIVNIITLEYVCIAKNFGLGNWKLGNVDLLHKILDKSNEYGDKTNLVLGTENDDVFMEKYITNGADINDSNKWELYDL